MAKKQPRGGRAPFRPFIKQEARLAADHNWRATPGHSLCVIARGELRFEFPQTWVTFPGPTSIKLHDKPPPGDDMVLEVSVLHAPPMDWTRITLAKVLQDSLHGRGHLLGTEALQTITLPAGIEIVWSERREKDEALDREAIWRQAYCRQTVPAIAAAPVTLLGILTFGFWPEAQDAADAIWNHMLHSLVMGEQIADPAQGPQRYN